jgi:hypothetical protein
MAEQLNGEKKLAFVRAQVRIFSANKNAAVY